MTAATNGQRDGLGQLEKEPKMQLTLLRMQYWSSAILKTKYLGQVGYSGTGTGRDDWLCIRGLAYKALPIRPCRYGPAYEALPRWPCPYGPAYMALPMRPCLWGPAYMALPIWPCLYGPAYGRPGRRSSRSGGRRAPARPPAPISLAPDGARDGPSGPILYQIV